MKIIPFGNNVLVKPIVKTQILVADKASLCEYGQVLAVGEDVGNHWFWLFRVFGIKKKNRIKVGDTIGFLVWGIQELDVEGTKHFFVPETSDFILGTLHE